MAYSKFSLDGPAFEDSTRQVIQPDHIMPVQEESKFSLDDPAFEGSTRQVIQPDHIMPVQEEVGVDTQIFPAPPGSPASQEEQGGQAADAPDKWVLEWIMEDARDDLHAFQEFEHYSFGVNSGSDCDVPEDELTDEMDIPSDEDQLDPVNLQEEEGPTEGDHGQQSPGNIPVDDTIAIEENIEPSPVNLHVTLLKVQVTVPEDPSAPRRLDLNTVPIDSDYPEADQEVIPELQLDVKVQTVTTTSAAEGESSSSSQIVMDIHADPNPPEFEGSYELLQEAVNGDSVDLPEVNETPLKTCN